MEHTAFQRSSPPESGFSRASVQYQDYRSQAIGQFPCFQSGSTRMVKITIKAPRPEEVRSESESDEGEESSEEEVEVGRSQGSGRSKRSW